MQPNYQAMLHCGVRLSQISFVHAAAADGYIYLSIYGYTVQAVRQTVRIVTIDHPQNLLRTGDRATVIFEFIAHPEFVKAGMKLSFREGKTKVIEIAIIIIFLGGSLSRHDSIL